MFVVRKAHYWLTLCEITSFMAQIKINWLSYCLNWANLVQAQNLIKNPDRRVKQQLTVGQVTLADHWY